MGPEWPTMLGLCSPKWGSGKVNATYATPNYFSVTMQKSLRWGLRRPTLPPFHYSSITMQSIAIKVILNYLYLKGASHEGASRHESFENVWPFPFGVLAGWAVLSILIYAFVCFELQLLRCFFSAATSTGSLPTKIRKLKVVTSWATSMSLCEI